MQVIKKSGRPFKSGNKVNTVKGTTINPYTGHPALTFVEDDSCVDIHKCLEYNPSGECAKNKETLHIHR